MHSWFRHAFWPKEGSQAPCDGTESPYTHTHTHPAPPKTFCPASPNSCCFAGYFSSAATEKILHPTARKALQLHALFLTVAKFLGNPHSRQRITWTPGFLPAPSLHLPLVTPQYEVHTALPGLALASSASSSQSSLLPPTIGIYHPCLCNYFLLKFPC